ncbi:MAG: TIGR00341 family protein [Anaerolineae bacterium]|nr:TIGR00341 family protein [Anaerolineae bacterium]
MALTQFEYEVPSLETAERHTIVVPLANPFTAPVLLELATVLAGKEQGYVVGLLVLSEETPYPDDQISQMQNIIRAFRKWDDTCDIELITRRTPQIAEGIVAAAREFHARQILLGLTDPVRGYVELGRVVEAVIDEAPCDVLVYRDSDSPGFTRVVVPVGGSVASRVTVQIGLKLAQGTDRPCEVLHVYTNQRPEWESRARVERMLAAVRGHNIVQTKVLPGINEADSVLGYTNENDILVVGKSERSDLEKWLYGNTAQRLVDRATGPVLLVARSLEHSADQAAGHRRLSWLRPTLAEAEQDQIIWSAQDTASPSLDYFVLLIVASFLASLGLLLDSGAVVIGAMLVAPLMGPIVSFGVGLCTARFRLLRQSIVTVILGVMVAFLVGFTIGKIAPLDAPTKELVGRGFPSILDAGVALGAGFIAAYATARRGIPAALAGVAIAAALVPPVNAIGLNLAFGEMRLALGAALLFCTNLVSIALVAGAVFFWLGMRPQRLHSRHRRLRYASVLGIMALLVPVLVVLLNFGHQVSTELISPNAIKAVFAPAQVVNIKIVQHDPVIVQATILASDEVPRENVTIAQDILSSELGEPVQLQAIVQRIVEGHIGSD